MEEALEAQQKALNELREKGMTETEVQWLKPQLEAMIQQRVDELLKQGKVIKTQKPGIYYVPAVDTGKGMPGAFCSVSDCKQYKLHMSVDVLFRWAQKHKEKTGHPILSKNDVEATVYGED